MKALFSALDSFGLTKHFAPGLKPFCSINGPSTHAGLTGAI
jgi:hypothetical protein